MRIYMGITFTIAVLLALISAFLMIYGVVISIIENKKIENKKQISIEENKQTSEKIASNLGCSLIGLLGFLVSMAYIVSEIG